LPFALITSWLSSLKPLPVPLIVVAGPASQASFPPPARGPLALSPVMQSSKVITPVVGLRSKWTIASSCWAAT
jgi:hypothetical protein